MAKVELTKDEFDRVILEIYMIDDGGKGMTVMKDIDLIACIKFSGHIRVIDEKTGHLMAEFEKISKGTN